LLVSDENDIDSAGSYGLKGTVDLGAGARVSAESVQGDPSVGHGKALKLINADGFEGLLGKK
jgi:hypothetical protein